ncbi:MAG: HAD hydrolase family protein [Actinomycetes bacterium]
MNALRLIATDLDGTLLNPAGRITDADAAALRAASERGILIVVATGRPARWLDCLAPIAAARPYVIISNGAAVFDLAARRVIERRALDAETILHVADALRAAFPGVLFALEHGEVFGCELDWAHRVPEGSGPHSAEDAVTVRAPLHELLTRVQPVVKMLAIAPGRSSDELAHAASVLVGDRAVVTHTTPPGLPALLEISASGVSKAGTLADFCHRHGVDASEVAAFGDMPNDLGMLSFAGRPFAMGNAHPALRERFEVVGSNAEGGVGATVRRLLRVDPISG